MNGKYILKSGTDFRQFSVITLDFTPPEEEEEGEAAAAAAPEEKIKAPPPPQSSSGRAKVEVEMVEVTADKFAPDEDMARELDKYTGEEYFSDIIKADFSPFKRTAAVAFIDFGLPFYGRKLS